MFPEIIEQKVKNIVREVWLKGDSALLAFTKKFDKVLLKSEDLKISKKIIKKAYGKVDKDFLTSIRIARKNVTEFYTKNKKKSWRQKRKGVILGEIWRPMESVGVYIPGGRYPYPSTILMTVIPAKIAGVRRIVIVTPPGNLTPEVLVTADMVGIDEIYQVGGAQAIAALAYGTQTISKVDKIVGPGNIYVTCAKKVVFGDVGIDLIAGPSEVTILADARANADYVACDLLAQVEHGMEATAFLVTNSRKLLREVKKKLASSVKEMRDIQLIQVKSINQAVEVINKIAPEHLEILIENPAEILPKIKNAGAIFLGEFSPVAIGDYIAGPSHVLPTGGAARFSSGLGVEDFFKKSSIISYDKGALRKYAGAIEKLAKVEGLKAHAETIKVRFSKNRKS